MQALNPMDTIPLPLVLVVTIVVVLVAIEIGFRIGLWRSRKSRFDSEALLSAMTGANLALLAFILAFSFSQAAGHHAARKNLIIEEANAIGTVYLRAGLVEPAYGEAIQQLMDAYLETRLTVARAGDYDAEKVVKDSLAIQTAIWEQVQLLAHSTDVDEVDALLVESINALFDLHERRVSAGLRNRIPSSIWAALSVLLVLSMLGIGHFSGMKGKRNPVSSTALALSFSMVLYLIADLDRPTGGLVRADQSAILQLGQKTTNGLRRVEVTP